MSCPSFDWQTWQRGARSVWQICHGRAGRSGRHFHGTILDPSHYTDPTPPSAIKFDFTSTPDRCVRGSLSLLAIVLTVQPTRGQWTVIDDSADESSFSIDGIEYEALEGTRFDGGVECGTGEQRCIVVTRKEHITKLLTRDATGGPKYEVSMSREPRNNLIIAFNLLRLLPPSWYRIVFALAHTTPQRYQAVPASKLLLDGYPKHTGQAVEGFTTPDQLRLVLYPPAWRFFLAKLHIPLLADGAWPSTIEVQESGYLLSSATRLSMSAHLDAACSEPALTPWCDDFRADLVRRHWPREEVAVSTAGTMEAAVEAFGGMFQKLPPDSRLSQALSWPVWLISLCKIAESTVRQITSQMPPDIITHGVLHGKGLLMPGCWHKLAMLGRGDGCRLMDVAWEPGAWKQTFAADDRSAVFDGDTFSGFRQLTEIKGNRLLGDESLLYESGNPAIDPGYESAIDPERRLHADDHALAGRYGGGDTAEREDSLRRMNKMTPAVVSRVWKFDQPRLPFCRCLGPIDRDPSCASEAEQIAAHMMKHGVAGVAIPKDSTYSRLQDAYDDGFCLEDTGQRKLNAPERLLSQEQRDAKNTHMLRRFGVRQ